VTTKVKICGLQSEPALEAALAGGADYIGLVFFAPSPRCVALDGARTLAASAHRGGAEVVALLVDPDDALIDRVVAAAEPEILQLHGSETPARAAEIGRRWGRQVMKAIPVAAAGDAEAALAYAEAAELILFDAKAPTGATRPAATGHRLPGVCWAMSRTRSITCYRAGSRLKTCKRPYAPPGPASSMSRPVSSGGRVRRIPR
jgi:phosphoribosylanthranilate isomerase